MNKSILLWVWLWYNNLDIGTCTFNSPCLSHTSTHIREFTNALFIPLLHSLRAYPISKYLDWYDISLRRITPHHQSSQYYLIIWHFGRMLPLLLILYRYIQRRSQFYICFILVRSNHTNHLKVTTLHLPHMSCKPHHSPFL